MNIFVDTSAFVALADQSDQNHEIAKTFFKETALEERFERWITTNFILDEVLTRIATTLGPDKAFAFTQNLFKSAFYHIKEVDLPLFREALHLMIKYRDKQLSFTDLTSFALMRREKIRNAFCFDQDFQKVGFNTLP